MRSPKQVRARAKACAAFKGVRSASDRYDMVSRVPPEVIAARLAEVPDEDHRNITGRVFGDPNPADRRRRT